MAHYNPGPGFTPQQPYPQPGMQANAPIYPPQPIRRGRRWLAYGLTAFVSLFLGIGIGASGDAETSAAGPRPTVTVTETEQAEPATTVTETVTVEPEQAAEEESGPRTTIPGDGQYLVGEDIKPGTYKTAGTDGFNCYWARLKNASGELSAIIANDNVSGQTRATLKKGEYFETKGCQDWKQVG
ncbi:hypothetical protein ACIBQX_20970 [Nonomuraea sp. NPDC049714]|uniref:hypothetical protein n=1 Tax=Nonomuraea sp. NPDC049714 TaxID=3364357 RepID=UPI0037A01869